MGDRKRSRIVLRSDQSDFEEQVRLLLQDDNWSENELSDSEEECEDNTLDVNNPVRILDHDVYDSEDEDENDPDFIPDEGSDYESDSDAELDPDEVPTLRDNTDWPIRNNNVGEEIPLVYLGKNDFEWDTQEPNQRVRTPARNIIRFLPGVSFSCRSLGNSPPPLQVFKQIFSPIMLEEIVRWTNFKLQESANKKTTQRWKSIFRKTDFIEISAYLGLLLYASIFKSSKESIRSLFSSGPTGRPVFRGTMSCERFCALNICLRFDDPTDRDIRRRTDKAAAISKLFNQFIQNSQQAYSLGKHVTIDEMLIPFRGKCNFIVYMPNKPAKYGIKIMAMVDASTGYFYDGYIYSGRNSDGNTLTEEQQNTMSKPTQCVYRLTRSIHGSHRNVTADNYFSSIELCMELEKVGLTYVGTVRKNKPQIPPEFLPNRKRPVGSSLFGFHSNITLVSFVPKINKSVILISTMHNAKDISDCANKPEIIVFYNKTKGGVDAVDYKTGIYSSQRKSFRWPLTIFYRLVDLAALNSFILYTCFCENPMKRRFQFVQDLAEQLVKPHQLRRLSDPKLKSSVKMLIKDILKLPPEPSVQPTQKKLEKRIYCSQCPPKIKRKTAYVCAKCQKGQCLQCGQIICKICLDATT